MITCQFYFIVAHGGGIEYKNDCRIVLKMSAGGWIVSDRKEVEIHFRKI
jgi:hypothetical protein